MAKNIKAIISYVLIKLWGRIYHPYFILYIILGLAVIFLHLFGPSFLASGEGPLIVVFGALSILAILLSLFLSFIMYIVSFILKSELSIKARRISVKLFLSILLSFFVFYITFILVAISYSLFDLIYKNV